MARGDGAFAHYGYDQAMAYLKDILLEEEGATEESVKELLDSDGYSEGDISFAWDAVWEDVQNDVTELMGQVQKKSGHEGGYWIAEVSNFGWRHLSGESDRFYAEDAATLLRHVLPNTDCDYYVFDGGDHITIDNAHHDAPTGGEIYTIVPVDQYRIVGLYPEGETDSYGDSEYVWEDAAWGSSATDAAERAFGEDERTHEACYRNITAGPDDTATGEGWGGYPDKAWFRIRVERA